MNTENKDFLNIKNLVVEYTSDGQTIHAVNQISLQLKQGETLGLVGETGAGKTTIVKAIERILPDPPAKIRGGEIWFEGKDILKLDQHSLREIRGGKISMIFQDPMTALNPVMRIGNQIAEGIRLHKKCSKWEARKEAERMLEMVGIPESRYREYPHQFSGGMKQRVVIAMALACHPKLLLADEPTSALDVTIQAQVLDLINDLKIRQKTSMILVTHDLGVVAETCDHVAIIYAGQIVEYGSLKEIFEHASHPYTIGLFKALPNMNDENKRLEPVGGMPPDPSRLPEGCYFSPRCPYAISECMEKPAPVRQLEGTHICKCHRACEITGKAGDFYG